METRQLDLNEIANKQQLTLNIAPYEQPAEMGARLRREQDDAKHARRIELTLYSACLGVIGTTFFICAYIVLFRDTNSETSKWATALLTSIVTGLVGYATGRAKK